MTLSHGFRQLANVLENLEANGLEVLDVATTDDEPSERLTVDLTVTVPIDVNEPPTESPRPDDEAPDDAKVRSSTPTREKSTAEVRERVLDPLSVSRDATNGATAIKTPDEGSTDEAESDSKRGEAGRVTDPDVVDCPIADCDATFESDHGMKIHRTKVHGQTNDGTDDSSPAYRDPDRLREVYAACDSFTEMREALETDVSAQTVRRQMIAHDIYEPGESGSGSKATGDAGDGAIEGDGGDDEVGDDGVGEVDVDDDEDGDEEDGDEEDGDDGSELETTELPEGVTVADLKAAVCSAQTLYDVQQRFDLERDEAMQLLDKYDLLEIVHGRVSNRDRRKQVDEDEITRRILEHAPVTRPSRA